MGVERPAHDTFGDVEEGQTAQEWERRGSGGQFSSSQQDKDGKKKEDDEKKN